jgi:hypothetical protein
MSYDPALAAMHRRQEIMDKEANMSTPKRTVPKNSVALIISKEPGPEGEEAFLDLQVMSPEEGDNDGYLTSIANLAANLLENTMFGDDDDDVEEELELDSAFFDAIDLGED